MYVLLLNDMRASKIEIRTEVCRADSEIELQQLLEREKVEAYNDGEWGKAYRKGGPLEWFNPPFDPPVVRVGSRQEYVDRAISNANAWYSELEQRIPTLESLNAKST